MSINIVPNEWNITAKDIKYTTIETSSTAVNSSEISTNQFYIINPATGKKITLKYQGNADYDFVLPSEPPSTTTDSVLTTVTTDQQNTVLWQPTSNVVDKPGWWISLCESQPPAATNGAAQPYTASLTATWTNPSQIKITISDKYLPVADIFKVSISFKQTSDAANYTTVEKEYTISSLQKIENIISSIEVLKSANYNNTWSASITSGKATFYAVQVAGLFSITIAAYNSALTSAINTYTISNLQFTNPGWPLPPDVTVSAVSNPTQYNVKIKANNIVSRDDDPNTTDVSIASTGAPKIRKYQGNYTIKNLNGNISTRYGAVSTTSLTFEIDRSTNLISDTSTEVTRLLTDLYPDGAYEVKVRALNNVSDIYSDYNTVLFTAPSLSHNDYIDSRTITQANSRFKSDVSYQDGGPFSTVTNLNNAVIVYRGNTAWDLVLSSPNIGIHVFANRGLATTDALMRFNVEDVNSNTPIEFTDLAYCDVKGFPAPLTAPNITASETNKPTTTLTVGAPVDYGNTVNIQGYYLMLPITNIRLNISTITFGYGYKKYILRLRQKFYNTIPAVADKTTSLTYYITDVNSDIYPAITSVTAAVDSTTVSDNSKYAYISGIRVSRGKVKLAITKITATNMGRCFYVQDWIKYSFLNVANYTLTNTALTTDTDRDLSLSNNTVHTALPAIDTGVHSGNADYTTYAANPALTITIKNISISNDTTNSSVNIPVIVDRPSIDIAVYTSNVLTNAGVYVQGVHMKYPNDITSTTALDAPTYTAFSIARTVYDHTEYLTAANNSSLMLASGRFCAASYSKDGAYLYRDYSSFVGNSGVDYSTISKNANDYRYAVFRWSYSKNISNVGSLYLRITGLVSGNGVSPPIKQVSTLLGKKITTIDDKDLRVYYRFEDNRTATQNPAYINTNPQAPPTSSISSIWINAHIDAGASFMGNLANRASNTTHGGLITVNTTNDSVTYQLATPSFTPATYTTDPTVGPYLYAIIGLPSDANIAFERVQVTF